MARKSGSSDKAGAGAGKGPKGSVAAGKTVANLVVKMGAQPEAQTIVYIHGIGNKPPPATLKCQWDNALFGVELGDRSRLAYWVNREFYPTPTADTCTGDDVVRVDDDQMTTKAVLILSKQPEVDDKAALDAEIAGLSANEDERKLLRAIAGRMGTPVPDQQHAYGVLDLEAKILPLPAFMRRHDKRRRPGCREGAAKSQHRALEALCVGTTHQERDRAAAHAVQRSID